MGTCSEMEPIGLKTKRRVLECSKPVTDKRKQDITDQITEPIAMHIIVMKHEVFKRLIETLERSYSIPKRSRISEALICMHSNPQDHVLTQKRSSTAASLAAGIQQSEYVHYRRRENLKRTLDKHLESQVNTLSHVNLRHSSENEETLVPIEG